MTTVTQNKAFKQAVKEGLRFFWAHMHVGNTIRFVGQSWEDGGFHTDSEGNPTSDNRGNTVAKFVVETLDPADKQHVDQVSEWYGE